MRKIVVDSSVVIKWFVAEPLSTEAQALFASYQAGAIILLAPDFICAEIGNIVWKKHLYQGLDTAGATRWESRSPPRFFFSLLLAKTPFS